MSKKRSVNYVCQECGSVYTKWTGKCESCNSWNTIVEEIVEPSPVLGGAGVTAAKKGKVGGLELHAIDEPVEEMPRIMSGSPEFDRVLGGGLVRGAAVLLGGDPGIGKSTLLLQTIVQLAESGVNCMYISGEESVEQVKLRALRLGLTTDHPIIATATLLTDIIHALNRPKAPEVVVIDSIQTMYHDEIPSAPGTVTQVRACAFELIRVAKQRGIAILLVGHVTKEGQIAGPKVLEHMVDAVLYFEGERGHQFRIVRAIKNRYGAANEIGVFEMTEVGLREVSNPSEIFLPTGAGDVSGSCIFAGMEGTRPILVEVQALVVPSFLASPRRAVVGWDHNRLAMVIAVLNARFGLNLLDKEVYLNVAGGLRINEPAADLAVAMALISSSRNLPISREDVFFGEIALSGEVRQVSHVEARLAEAAKLGFSRAIIPNNPQLKSKGLATVGIISIIDVENLLISSKSR
jgi:DNA repair protein RadA/Sms